MELELKQRKSNGISWREIGTGEPLLLVHGFPLSHRMWNAQFSELSKRHHVIAIDLPGFGDSDPIDHDTLSIEMMADACAAVLDNLQIAKATFCGLSMGGYVGWQFWLRHADRLSKLIQCDTRAAADDATYAKARHMAAARTLSDGNAWIPDAMMPKLVWQPTAERNSQIVAQLTDMICSTRPETIAAAQRGMAGRIDASKILSEITCPTLVVCGEHDAISPAAEMKTIAAQMPNATFKQINDSGHMAPMEQPTVFNQTVLDFLSRD